MQRLERCDHISLYIPPKRPIEDVISQLKAEQRMAMGIKDRETKILILGLLQEILDRLGYYLITERPNGLIFFASPEKIEEIAPDKPLNISLYRCDTQFYRDPHL